MGNGTILANLVKAR